jgi:hypothetical protein
MTTPEAPNKDIRSVPYGEITRRFFDRDMVEKISQGGDKPVDLEGLMSAFGLHVIPERRGSLFDLLCSEKYGLNEILRRTPQGGINFPSKMIFQVTGAIESASVEQAMIEAIAGGIGNFY